MSGFIEGENRYQSTLCPESVDEYIEEGSVVRVIDVFIDRLDKSGLGFKAEAAESGRPGYHPVRCSRSMSMVTLTGCIPRDAILEDAMLNKKIRFFSHGPGRRLLPARIH